MNDNQFIQTHILKNNTKLNQLLRYTNLYIQKPNLYMKPIIISIRNNLINGQDITIKQLKSIISFLRYEKPHRGQSDKNIIEYYSCFIKKPSVSNHYKSDSPFSKYVETNHETPNNLTQFFN